MKSPLDRLLSWPQPLDFVLEELESGTDQDFVETQMERGPPRRRATATPYAILFGDVQVGKAEKELLVQFSEKVRGTRFLITPPGKNEKMLGWFRNGTPFLKVQSFSSSGEETHLVGLNIGLIKVPAGID
jgi:hypothetical protein